MRRLVSRLRAALFLGLAVAAVPTSARGDGADQPALYGGIEIGAKGIKAVALPVDEASTPDLSQVVSRLPHKAVNNVTLGDRAPDGSFRPEAIAEARAAVGDFYRHLTRTLKIRPKRIWIVASSGLMVNGDPPNFDALRKAVSEATGEAKSLERIDQETEVDLLIRGAIPRRDWGDAILIDVGSGSVKCGYHHPQRGLHVARNYVVSTVIEGSIAYTRTIQKEVARTGGRGFADFCAAANRLRKDAVIAKVADEIGRKPGLENRTRVFLSGGVPWAIATLTNPVEMVQADRLTVPVPLTAISQFREKLRSTGNLPRLPDISSQPEPVRAQIEQQVREVCDTFTKENLLAGAEVLLGFAEVLKWEQLSKEVYFTQSGVVAWIVGYVDRAR